MRTHEEERSSDARISRRSNDSLCALSVAVDGSLLRTRAVND